jgi:TolB-like protein
MLTIQRFGPFRLDTEAQILYRGTEPVGLGRRAVALLCVLVARPGTPVPKDALIEAGWSGLVVDDGNLTVQIGALRRVFGEEPGGDSWIETMPRHGYRFVGPPVTTEENAPNPAPIERGLATLALPDRPSIAVLPFANLSGDLEQEYFADGIVEDIITALSRMRWLFVIARNSSFTYKGRSVDIRQVGCELGVRYVLEGSVRKSANRVRITGQLIDVSMGAHIWADRFDGAMEDIFDLQDQVAASVVGAIAPKVEHAEIERAKRKPTENLDAYDYYLRGIASVYQPTKDANDDALRLFYKAIELDPDFASAYGMAAWCYAWRMTNGWMVDRAKEVAETARLALQAVELGKDDAVALTMGGVALALVLGDVEDGAAFIDRALILNPNLATGWLLSGWVNLWLGRPEVEIERATRAVRLSPLDPSRMGSNEDAVRVAVLGFARPCPLM